MSRALNALSTDPKPPSGRLLRVTEEGSIGGASRRDSERGGGMGLVRRSFSMMTGRASSVAGSTASAAAPGYAAGGPPALHRSSSGSVHSLGGASVAGSGRGMAPPSLQQPSIGLYSFSGKLPAGGSLRDGLPPPQFRLQHLRSDRTSSGPLGGSDGGGLGNRVVSLGSPVKSAAHSHGGGGYGRRHTHAGAGIAGHSNLAATRSFTALCGGTGAASFGRASDMSSLSSWHHNRAHSDDGRVAEHEGEAGRSSTREGGNVRWRDAPGRLLASVGCSASRRCRR